MKPSDRDAIPNGHCIRGKDALDVVRNRSLQLGTFCLLNTDHSLGNSSFEISFSHVPMCAYVIKKNETKIILRISSGLYQNGKQNAHTKEVCYHFFDSKGCNAHKNEQFRLVEHKTLRLLQIRRLAFSRDQESSFTHIKVTYIVQVHV